VADEDFAMRGRRWWLPPASMSESSTHAQTSFPGTSAFVSAPGEYRLSDDLARLCLPQEYRDSYRKLAWANSICFLFLVVGLIGLKAPRVIVRPIAEATELVPVIFTPPEEQPKPEVKQDEPEEQPTETPTETPQVAAVVAAVDSPSVAFAVPVPGAVAIAPMAHLASPPPPVLKAPPAKPTQFNPNAGGEGSFPEPEYPAMAQRNHYQGTVVIEIMVSETGAITSAKVFKTSGFTILDEAALQAVQRRWRFPPGAQRWYQWSCIFRLQ
jgi:protein TonB